MPSITRWAIGVVILALMVGCSTAPTEPSKPASGVNPILATTVLRVGEQRVAFVLAGPKGIIQDPSARITPVFLGSNADGPEIPGAASQAQFHLWPYGIRGSYSTQLNFDRPGRWRLDIETEPAAESATEPATEPTVARLELEVSEQWEIPDIGSLPPTGNNKTLETVPILEELTTDFEPDPDLYRMTIDQAIASGKPSVVVFATPAFCTSPTCGPQVDTVSMLKDLRAPDANFIHVELYDNPVEIQGDLSRGELVAFAEDWGFTTIPDWLNESWVFVLDPEGRIHQRFEGYATLEELDEALGAASNRAS